MLQTSDRGASAVSDQALAAAHRLAAGAGQAAVDVVALARQLGLEVDYIEFSQAVRCALLQPQGIKPSILINSILPPEEQQRACAHALGHWELHRQVSAYFICGAAAAGSLEDEANAFADRLLGQEGMRRENG